MFKFNAKYWAIILGGSSGFGLKTAQKLSRHGMNLCIVHLDRKKLMDEVNKQFDDLRAQGIKVVTLNINALYSEGIKQTLSALKEAMSTGDSIRLLLHSIAYGNLKFLAPPTRKVDQERENLIAALARKLEIESEKLRQSVDELFELGQVRLSPMTAMPTPHSISPNVLGDDDFALTIHSMGSSLATWVRAVFEQKLFAPDGRVVSLTSEGSQVAWPGYAAVAAAKATLEAVSRSIAVEYAPYGIRSNVIQAGITRSPASQKIPGYKHLEATAKMRNPFGRLTGPEDVANAIFLLCLDEAAWINGAIIRVDGGEHVGSFH